MAAPETSETVVWGSLSYHVPELGGRVKGAVCLIAPRRGHVELGFVHGALLPDPRGLLTGSQKEKRVVRVERIEDVRRPGMFDLVKAAVEVRPDAALPFPPKARAASTTRARGTKRASVAGGPRSRLGQTARAVRDT